MVLDFITDGNDVKMCSEHNGQGYVWNNYGAQPDSDACKEECINDSDCAFVLFRPSNRYCTKFPSCTRTRQWGWAGDQVYVKSECVLASVPEPATDTSRKCKIYFSVFSIYICILIVCMFLADYFTGPSALSQSSAEAYCQDNGGHLASIRTDDEFEASEAACAAAGASICWIGLLSEGGSSDWSWTDGSTLALGFGFNCDGTPTTGSGPWAEGEPNDSGSNEDCGDLRNVGSEDVGFNDSPCSQEFIPLCQKSNGYVLGATAETVSYTVLDTWSSGNGAPAGSGMEPLTDYSVYDYEPPVIFTGTEKGYYRDGHFLFYGSFEIQPGATVRMSVVGGEAFTLESLYLEQLEFNPPGHAYSQCALVVDESHANNIMFGEAECMYFDDETECTNAGCVYERWQDFGYCDDPCERAWARDEAECAAISDSCAWTDNALTVTASNGASVTLSDDGAVASLPSSFSDVTWVDLTSVNAKVHLRTFKLTTTASTTTSSSISAPAPAPTHYMIVNGRGDLGVPECALASSTAASSINNGMAVQCCNEAGTSANRDGCLTWVDYSQAQQACADAGHRLCTQAEVEDKLGAGTGCGFDRHYVWTSDSCDPDSAGDANDTMVVVQVSKSALELLLFAVMAVFVVMCVAWRLDGFCRNKTGYAKVVYVSDTDTEENAAIKDCNDQL